MPDRPERNGSLAGRMSVSWSTGAGWGNRLRFALSFLVTTGGALAFGSAMDLFLGGLVGTYPPSAFLSGILFSILFSVAVQAARSLHPSPWLALPYVAFGAMVGLDGLIHSELRALPVAGALFALALLHFRAFDPRVTQADRDAWLFAALAWDPTWQRRLPARARIAWMASVCLVATVLGGLALASVYWMPREHRWILLAFLLSAFLALTGGNMLFRRLVLGRLEMEEDQRAAQRIQSRLLPAALPSVPGFDLAAHYSPFRLVGGDYYDVRRLDDSRILVAVADVSGKGTPAAILTANLQASLHVLLFAHAREYSLEAAATTINAAFVHHTESNRFVTMVLGVLDVEARRLRYINAGHNPPLAVAPDGSTRRLEATGLPLGMLEASEYSTAEIEIEEGTVLLFYTDGLSERADPSGDLYGEERILSAMRGARAESAERILEAIASAADRFARGTPPEDDTAMLLVKSVVSEGPPR